MSFRPQFPVETPVGFRDEDYVQHFDATNTPTLMYPIAPGQGFSNIPLQFDPDTDFVIGSIEVIDPSGLAGLRFRTPEGDYLSQGLVLSQEYAGAGPSGSVLPVPQEPEILCPRSGVFLMDVANLQAP